MKATIAILLSILSLLGAMTVSAKDDAKPVQVTSFQVPEDRVQSTMEITGFIKGESKKLTVQAPSAQKAKSTFTECVVKSNPSGTMSNKYWTECSEVPVSLGRRL
jgi:hypothetical protein